MKKILVIGSDSRSFLAVIRSLGRQGHVIHCLADVKHAPALKSKYISHFHYLRPVYINIDDWLQALKSIVEDNNIDHIIPCTDHSLLPLIERKHGIPMSKIFFAGVKAFKLFHDKWETRCLATDLGVPVAKSYALDTEKITQFPVFVKPKSSVTQKNLQSKKVVVQCKTWTDLKKVKEKISQPQNYFIEEAFDGIGIGISVLAAKGKIVYAFQHQRTVEGVAGGSSVRKSVPLDPTMFDAVKKLADAAQLEGVAMFEFRYSPQNRHFVLLEVNARFWGSLPLAIFAGINFPSYAIQKKIKPAMVCDANYKTDRYSVALQPAVYDVQRTLSAMTGAGKVFYLFKRFPQAFWRFMTGQAVIDSFEWTDLAPFWCELSEIFHAVYTKTLRKIGFYSAIRRHVVKKQLSSLSKPVQSIYILCSGNICRSPFLAAYLSKKLSKTVSVKSAGFLMPEYRNSPDNAVKAASHMNVNLSDHQSALATDHDMAQADLIIYFDQRNKQNIQAFYPEYCHKAIACGDLLSKPQDIADPYGGGLADFKKCYVQILQAADCLLNALIQTYNTKA